MNTAHSKPLRIELRAAVNQRDAAIRNGRSHRKDLDRVRAAIGRATVFLDSYPVASDAKVREWCNAHMADVRLIVPGSNHRALGRLIMDELKPAATEAA